MITRRVGMIFPSLNVVVEDDMRRALPADVGGHSMRVRLQKTAGRVTQAALLAAGDDAVQQAGMLADAGVDAICFNCTGASLADGPEGARRLRDRLAEATGIASTTTILSVVGALKARGVKTLVHLCPFTAEFGADEANFLRAEGFDVVASHGLNFTDARLAANMTPEEIVEIALKLDRPDADGLFLACANVRALEACPEIERRLGKPVICSNQAVIWDLLDMIGHPEAAAALGRTPVAA